jgi:hypothetical protein
VVERGDATATAGDDNVVHWGIFLMLRLTRGSHGEGEGAVGASLLCFSCEK